ncbi:glycosyltransferase family 4 protein [Effusibacillus lacus]|uniref:Glycosyltransferase family 1 protein n=1 Tax=Effusibacillus lacus TaxID=1348429 RepID=A0A292YUC4_9BACL|nr:glycosyltransferase family 4 protein [Effusibacillus lacus]TCS73733.1 glycosyltransferase involved in cell wall biosynthesis [Effusibacillus lacus]GAX92054.1 glycosyltransferase family 1 protein [Effusibacillus lacus]
MKILQVTAVDFTLKKFLLPLVDALQNEGHTVDTACNCGEIGTELKRKGYTLHHIPFARNLNLVSHVLNVWRLIKLIKREKYHCIHTHTPVASIIARLAGKIARVPVIVYTAHGFYFHENMNPIAYNIAYYLEKIWGKYFTDYLFFQSREDYQLAFVNRFNLPDRLIHIGNGVSAELFNPSLYDRDVLRKNMGFVEDDIVLIFVGRQVREKGIEELIDAYKIVKEKHDSIKLMVVGGSVEGDRDGLDVSCLLNRLPEKVRRDVYLLGLRNDIPQLLSMADVFLLPSYREGLPRSIIEAMAMGKPIIATDIRGCREEIIPEFNGYLCQAKDSDDLARKILKLLEAPDAVKRFGQNSRELFLEEFDEKNVLEKQLMVFRNIDGEMKSVQLSKAYN